MAFFVNFNSLTTLSCNWHPIFDNFYSTDHKTFKHFLIGWLLVLGLKGSVVECVKSEVILTTEYLLHICNMVLLAKVSWNCSPLTFLFVLECNAPSLIHSNIWCQRFWKEEKRRKNASYPLHHEDLFFKVAKVKGFIAKI